MAPQPPLVQAALPHQVIVAREFAAALHLVADIVGKMLPQKTPNVLADRLFFLGEVKMHECFRSAGFNSTIATHDRYASRRLGRDRLTMAVRELFELRGQVALVTGGSRGLGLQIASALGEMGAKIALCARRPEELARAATTLKSLGIDAFTMVCDLAKPEQVPALVEAVVERYGTVDVLVNNAGTSWGGPAEELPLEAWDKVMRLNAGAVFQLSQAVANRCFIARRSGNIIIVASVAALRTHMNMKAASYYASKAAALHLTRALAGEWGPYGIRVNAICPGFFPSKMSRGLLEKIEASVIAQTPLGRLGNDTDLMGAAVYLASAASRHVTGQHICVDGGASIA
jgi:NAD(P)-dependent dehydrogenase (short-subunit alcohol dehydrogenase family)